MPVDTQAAVNALWGESVTYTVTGPGTTHAVTAGRHIDGEEEGRTSFGVYTIRKETYTLATDAISNWTPKLRDTVAPTGLPARVVTGIGGSPFLRFWKLSTSYPALADALDQTGTLLRATSAATNQGYRNPTYAAVGSTLAVRLQPDTREREWDTTGKVTTRSRFQCVFGGAVTLNAGDLIEVSSVRYEVTEQSEVESLGLLTFAAVERID